MQKKSPGLIELVFAGAFGVIGFGCFAGMQTSQPYALSQIRFCPQSANHPLSIENGVNRLNKERDRKAKKKETNIFGKPKTLPRGAKIEDFDPDAQEKLDEKYCHKPRYILAEEWEKYGKFGSKIPYKGDAISLVGDAIVPKANYIVYNFGAVLSLWGVTSCVLYRVNKLKRHDFEFSEQEKNLAYNIFLNESKERNLALHKVELDEEVTKEVRDRSHQELRIELGLTNPENEDIINALQRESALLGREAEHAGLRKTIAVANLETTKADVERNKLLKKGGKDNNDSIEEKAEDANLTIAKQGNDIVGAIADFGIGLEYLGAMKAPSVVRHRFKFGDGKKKKIADFQKLADDLALAIGLESTPRIVRDRSEIIVEVAREDREFPHIKDALKLLEKPKGESVILIGGIDFNGEIMLLDLLASPDCHGMFVGATKSGKSQGVYAQIACFIMMYHPNEAKLAIYDGKMSLILPEELKPWLFCETAIAGQGGDYVNLLETERVKRLELREGYRDVTEFNAECPDERLPYIVAIADEYSVDREMFEGEDADSNMMKHLGKRARSEGIHLYLGDQSGMDEDIDNDVKRNLGLRVVYRVVDQSASSYLKVDGAHQLLGKGDLIVKWEGHQYRCQMPNCSPFDLKEIASARLKELGLTPDDTVAIALETPQGEEYDWYNALQNWALDSDPMPNREEIVAMWKRLSNGTTPNKEQLDIFLENLEVLS